jgi:glyoxylase-like metal-dependent hydrolase (beta-lactamase superfamily II)
MLAGAGTALASGAAPALACFGDGDQPALAGFRCGTITADAGTFARGDSGEVTVPVPCYLLRHRDRNVLFDAGLHAEVALDAAARLGVMEQYFRHRLAGGEAIGAQLSALNIDPTSIDAVILSHMHYDHVGGVAQLPNARLIVGRREWSAAHEAANQEIGAYNPKDFDCGHDVELIEGEFDVFGDGAVTTLPTPGHTHGHQSLTIRSADGGEIILAADACYLCRTLDDERLPPFGADAANQLTSLRALRARRAAGARIFPGHDPAFWATLPSAPQWIQGPRAA